MNDTNDPVSAFILDEDLCEGCGEIKPCIIRYKYRGFEGFYYWIYNLQYRNKFLFALFTIVFLPFILCYNLKDFIKYNILHKKDRL